MNIIDILSKNLGINKLTASSLQEAIVNRYTQLPDNEKRRITHELAYSAIKTIKSEKRYEETAPLSSLPETSVLAINHTGPLDITIEWKTEADGTLKMTEYHIHSGGDQVNASKVFSDFGKNIALVALAGKKGEEITTEWERNFLNKNIIPKLIRSLEDQQVAIMNIVDGTALPVMFGWLDAFSQKTVEKINQETLKMLDKMFKGKQKTIWILLSAGGPVRYDEKLACYASLVKGVKTKYKNKVEFLIDFMHTSGPEEAISVLDIPRGTPQDIIKPNLEEFIQILTSSGLAEKGSLDKDTITKELIKEYAIKLRKKYNLLGILVSMDKAGLVLVMQDRIITEKGIKITSACHTAAGDSLKAGFVYALSSGKSFEEAVHTGNLFGASTASMKGTQTVTPETLSKTETLAHEQNIKPKIELL